MQRINVTKKELAAFVRDMGDSPINFHELYETSECGCLFVQYVKRAFPSHDYINAGLTTTSVFYDSKRTVFIFPIRYSDWCPLNKDRKSPNLDIKKFSELIIPEEL